MCARPNGDKIIQTFIDKAFAWYREAMEKTEDHARYLFTLLSQEQSESMVKANPEAAHLFPRGSRAVMLGTKRPSDHRCKRQTSTK